MTKVFWGTVASLAELALAVTLGACAADTKDTPARSPEATLRPTPTADSTPTFSPQTYENASHRYQVVLPDGYRVASLFMQRFSEVISNPERDIAPEDYVVITSLSAEDEQRAVEEASEEVAVGFSPWFGFAAGQSIHILPLEVIYPGVSLDSFLMNVDTAGIVRTNSEIREELTDSGESVTRLTRREVDDNGDFTYDLVLVGGDNPLVLRMVKTSDYNRLAFETVFRSLVKSAAGS